MTQPWWTDNLFGVWLGVATTVVAVGLALTCAWFALRGERRVLAMRANIGVAVFGAACVALCGLALLQGQHFRVWYPLLMMGAMPLIMFGPNMIALNWIYRQRETRRLAAEELRRS